MITVAIIEDSPTFRSALEKIIESESGLHLSGSYGNAEQAISPILEKKPDIVISDISLPGMRGTELLALLKPQLPGTLFMACTIHDDNETVFEALKAGASGYILKEPVTASEIVRSIHEIYSGGSPMSPYIARMVISSFQKPQIPDESALLSSREREVLELLSRGLLYKEIAEKLGITHETVKKHLKNIYQKLHVQNKIEALNKFRLL